MMRYLGKQGYWVKKRYGPRNAREAVNLGLAKRERAPWSTSTRPARAVSGSVYVVRNVERAYLGSTADGFDAGEVVVSGEFCEQKICSHVHEQTVTGLSPVGGRGEKEDLPRPLIHISTGVVNASPGVVKMPPCVLRSTADQWRSRVRG